MTHHVLITAEATVEVEALDGATEEQIKDAAEEIVFSNRYAWDYLTTTIL